MNVLWSGNWLESILLNYYYATDFFTHFFYGIMETYASKCISFYLWHHIDTTWPGVLESNIGILLFSAMSITVTQTNHEQTNIYEPRYVEEGR